MKTAKKIAILGGGEEELNILSEFHRNPSYELLGVYDRDPRAVALEIAEIIGIPRFSDESFLDAFRNADYIIVTDKRRMYEEELRRLRRENLKIINPSEAVSHLATDTPEKDRDKPPWPAHLEMALKYIKRITDRERLLKWLLEISVRAVQASSGSIMLHSEETEELYIGIASGLSRKTIQKTRQKLGEGIAGEVAGTRKTRLITEMIDTPFYSDRRDREKIQSAISTPLVVDGALVGVLNVSTNTGERSLQESDIDTIELLASKISPILDQHLRIDTREIREKEYEIRNFLETLFKSEKDFHEQYALLCRTLCQKLGADTVSIYTATDEGDWLILGGGDQHAPLGDAAPRIHCLKGCLARAYLNSEEVLMTEAVHETSLEIDRRKDSITSIYLPLVHNGPLGVVVIEFSMLDSFEKFLKLKDTLRFQVGFFVYTQLKELKQYRRMKRYEDLSTMTPSLMSIEDTESRIKRLPAMLSNIVNATMGSFYFRNSEVEGTFYFGFPESGPDRERRIKFDGELRERTLENDRPETTSYLGPDVGTFDAPPLYNSAVSFPIILPDDFTAVYNGYNKKPETPVDSSVFGEYDLEILEKVRDIVIPVFKRRKPTKNGRSEPSSFNELLRSNQGIFLERIREEIERADRYHHGFTVTLFRIEGLLGYYRVSSHHALDLINRLSIGIRNTVRRTDYFSWIETDTFGILSLESFQRISDLERRLTSYIDR
ncbi:MAG TPA: GAF domain-containing protein, partial [Candidatus Krumholzibacterium sp.]|nr:GAF domain-containing protein [Candidatus Krumholzibacterium sp.]